ncbi:MAG: helix-turn-helix transcriptional regulator [Candidatus Cybelea sp.]
MNDSTKKQSQRNRRLMSRGRPRVTRGGANVFSDLGFESPSDELAKAELALIITARIAELGLTQAQAAARMKIVQPKVSKILRGDVSGVSTGWLMAALLRLGRNVHINVKRSAEETGRLYVLSR